MDVKTIEVDGETLSTRKSVEVQSKQIETPVKALQVGKLRASEDVNPLARGIAEIYKKVDAAALQNSRSGWSGLADRLKIQAKNADQDEIIIPFIEYDDTAVLTSENAKEIAKLQANYGDLIVVPLMVPLSKAADNGDDRTTPHVSSIIRNTKTFLEAVVELEIRKPIMGVIPPVSEDCTTALTDLYMDFEVRGFCVDFNRRSPMAMAQIDNVINPLMQTLTSYGIRGESLIYAVNVVDSRPGKNDRRTADSMYAYTLGFDVFGDNHLSPDWPEEVFKEIAERNANSEIELRLFDADTVSVVEVPVSELGSFIPSEANLDVKRIQNRIAKNPDERYRFTNLINAELISIYLKSNGGIDATEIFGDLDTSNHSQEDDLSRVRELFDEVN